MILDLFIYIIQFYINQNTFLPGFIIRNEHSNNAWICTNSDHIGKLDELVNANYEATCLRINKGTTKVDVFKKIC